MLLSGSVPFITSVISKALLPPREEFLIVVVGGAPHTAVVKPNQVGVPFVESLLAEQRSIGGHNHHIGVSLQTGPVGGFGHSRCIVVIAAVIGKLAYKHAGGAVAVVGQSIGSAYLVGIIAIEIIVEPLVITVVMLVNYGVLVLGIYLMHIGIELAAIGRSTGC